MKVQLDDDEEEDNSRSGSFADSGNDHKRHLTHSQSSVIPGHIDIMNRSNEL